MQMNKMQFRVSFFVKLCYFFVLLTFQRTLKKKKLLVS